MGAVPEYLILFIFGMVGAVLMIYIAKQQVIPEFRSFYNVADQEAEIVRLQDSIEAEQKEIDRLQKELETIDSTKAQQYKDILESRKSDRDSYNSRLSKLQGDVRKNQILVRSLGFVCYIILGGVFATILSSIITIDSISEDIAKYIKPIFIGATWTSFLTALGLNFARSEASDQIKKIEDQITAKMNELKKDVEDKVQNAVATAETSEAKRKPEVADKVAAEVKRDIETTSGGIQQRLARTRSNVQRLLR